MLHRERAGIKSALVVYLCHKEGSRMPFLPELSCRYPGDHFLPYGRAAEEWAGGGGLRFFPLLLLSALHSKGSTTSRLCSHLEFAFFTLQSQYDGTWEGFCKVFFHCLRHYLQQQLSDALLPLSWSHVHPCRVVWILSSRIVLYTHFTQMQWLCRSH